MDAAFLRIVAAEDARPESGRDLSVLIEATRSDRQLLRRTAVRALGRLERPELAAHIIPLLDDPSGRVRASAANAMAQAHQTGPGHAALAPLVARGPVEPDERVRGVLARSVGRLTLTGTDAEVAEAFMLDVGGIGHWEEGSTTRLLGVALGLEATARRTRGEGLSPQALRWLRRLQSHQADESTSLDERQNAIRIRSLAFLTRGQSGVLTAEDIGHGLDDQAPEVSATALRYLPAIPGPARLDLARRGAAHSSLYVTIEALRFLSTEPRDTPVCDLLTEAAEPPPARPSAGPRVIAVDALALPCPDRGAQRAVLERVAGEIHSDDQVWQPAAHALVSLARLSPGVASRVLPAFVQHENPFVRAWAAQGATVLGDTDALNTLALDEVANVRTAAVTGLATLTGRAADAVLLRQLERDDAQLLMTTARLLEGTPDDRVPAALLDAFERISEDGRETRRDARTALLARLSEVGDPEMSGRLDPYLTDYDGVVAQDVADILQNWNGRPYLPLPDPAPRAALPTPAELRAMDGGAVVLHMAGGGRIEIALHPFESTTNTFRFWRLARSGHFDGLTFHRWAPSFVLQGGSPGANEYEGDAAFSRDEVGLRGHWRGTVGISTRGHDTGDGQIFVNLLDNVRLDHVYTIVGTVVSGMEVVDQALEGAVIERAEVLTAASRE